MVALLVLCAAPHASARYGEHTFILTFLEGRALKVVS